ncbi:MAG: dihydrofolate reductase family protein, partial [Ottowia sp.]|nr:dihydrofolate reductase family protein [Ottowia sp.]
AGAGHVELPALLAALAQRECNELHLEAGARLNAAFLAAGLVDELLLYQAPLLLGAGAPIAALPAIDAIAQGTRVRWREIKEFDGDIRLRGFLAGHDGEYSAEPMGIQLSPAQ